MRLDVHAVNMDLTSEMEQHAKLRAWQAVQRWPQRAVWVGVWLTDQHNAAGGAAGASAPAEMDSTRYSCRFDVWLRGVGVISVCQSEAEARCAVDVASARLVQAISARMRKCIRDDVRFAPDEWRYTAPAGASGRLHCDEPASRRSRCLAVLIERKNSGRRSKMLQWLRDQYGVEQVIRLSLPAGLWRKAALGSSLAMNLRERLSLSMLCWPQLIVVAGRASPADGIESQQAERQQVQRIVGQLRLLAVPMPIVGVWMQPSGEVHEDEVFSELVRSQPQTLATGRSAVAGRQHLTSREVRHDPTLPSDCRIRQPADYATVSQTSVRNLS
ncbi:MAG: hypothetical protein IT448_07470 [Phycisphaerales bacterium]|nr:hypothetical protein [Phycisphaerales bacterium]